jgi:hypothetical protein
MSNNPASTPVSETDSSMTVTSARQFNNQAAFENHVLFSLQEVEKYHEFLFTDVPGSWGEALFWLIDEKIKSL